MTFQSSIHPSALERTRAPRTPACNPLSRILVGASTGGVPSLETLLSGLEPPCPPIVIVQHMPGHFLARLAERFRSLFALPVRLVTEACPLSSGTIYLAGCEGHHLVFAPQHEGRTLALTEAIGDELHAPAIDHLLKTAASLPDAQATLGILLSGMGRDGAAGLCALHHTRAETWVEDPHTARVPSMPDAAIRMGAAPRILRGPSLGMALRQRMEHNREQVS